MSEFRYGIVSAMQEETEKIVKEFNLIHIPLQIPNIYFNDDIVLIESGIGKTASAYATTHLINVWQPDHIINIGLCGGINPDLKIGDTFLVNDVHQADVYKPFEGYEDFVAHITLENSYCKVKSKSASLATVDKFVDRIDSSLGFELSADIVDMEGYSVAYVCQQYRKQCCLIKSICDMCNENSDTDLYDNLELAMNNGIKILKKIIR